MLIVSSYKYSLPPCPLSLLGLTPTTWIRRCAPALTFAQIPGKSCIREAADRCCECQYAWKRKQRAHGALRTVGYIIPCGLWTSPNFFGELVRRSQPRCSHCRCSRRTRSLACARTWRRPGTSSASAGSSGPCPPPCPAQPGRRWTDTSRWCERERWSPSTEETLTLCIRSSRATGLLASHTPSSKTCGWTRTTERRRGSEGGRWDRWRSTGSARSSPCPAPSGTASRRRTASR